MFNFFKRKIVPPTLSAEVSELLAAPIAAHLSWGWSDIAKAEVVDDRLHMTSALPLQALAGALEQQLSRVTPPLTLEFTVQNPAAVSFHNSAQGQVRHIVLVASGKGGVGKSTTAVNIAVALAQLGARVGILDADIYGPSVPLMVGAPDERAQSADERFLNPIERCGIYVQSIGFLVDPTQATVWRGPMASQALWQLANETRWPDLDYLIVDLPPGTGDIQLTLAQKFKVAGAVVVTTPQDVALADAQKAIQMFQQVQIPVLGLVENMSFYQCPHCGHSDDIFGSLGGVALAERYQLPVLGQLPIDTTIRQSGDQGVPIASLPENQVAEMYKQIALQLMFGLYWHTQMTGVTSVDISMTDD